MTYLQARYGGQVGWRFAPSKRPRHPLRRCATVAQHRTAIGESEKIPMAFPGFPPIAVATAKLAAKLSIRWPSMPDQIPASDRAHGLTYVDTNSY